MKFIIQRVKNASVMIDMQITAEIQHGFLIYIGIHRNDTVEMCESWINKILKLRIFSDDHKPINRSIQDVNGEILLVSQFTLYADTKGQNRPSFIQAKEPQKAEIIYQHFLEKLLLSWPKTKSGLFAADMQIYSINDGPVTIILE